MEKDDEIKGSGNSLDFGERIFDPRLGRFSSLDPKGYKYPWITPYSYALNSPIKFVDKNGEGPDVIINKSSSKIKLTGSTTVSKKVVDKKGNTTIINEKGDEMAGSIVLNPGDVFYEVDEDVTITQGDKTITYSGGIGKIVRENGTVKYVEINDVDYIDVEANQTFKVNGKTVMNDANAEIDRNEEGGDRKNLPRKLTENVPQEDLDNLNDTQEKLKNPKEDWIPKPNKGEIKFSNSVGEIKISDEKGSNGKPTGTISVEKPDYFGDITTKEE